MPPDSPTGHHLRGPFYRLSQMHTVSFWSTGHTQAVLHKQICESTMDPIYETAILSTSTTTETLPFSDFQLSQRESVISALTTSDFSEGSHYISAQPPDETVNKILTQFSLKWSSSQVL